MFFPRRVLCVVSSFLIITAAPPAFAKPKDKHSLPPRATAQVDPRMLIAAAPSSPLEPVARWPCPQAGATACDTVRRGIAWSTEILL